MLYELLTGERLFMGESDFSTLEKVRNVEILPPSSYNKKIPEELERIVLKALAKDPEDRYQNAIDLHDDLQAFLYTKGELYSRKDLAAWMKKMFPAEIEEESTKAEQFRQIVAPVVGGPPPSPRKTMIGTGLAGAGLPGASSASAGTPAPQGSAKQNDMSSLSKKQPSNKDDMGWDDEELDTQIFEKDPTAEPEVLDTRDIFEDDDDRTVANEPPPTCFARPRPPIWRRHSPSSSVAPTRRPLRAHAPPARHLVPDPPGPPPGPPKTLFGMPVPTLPAPPSPSRPHGAATIPPPGTQRRLTRSSLSIPAAPALPPSFGSSRNDGQEGQFTAAPPLPARPSRAKLFAVAGVAALAIILGGAGIYAWSVNRAGKLDITAVPADSAILVENVKVADRSPFLLEKPPGSYTVSVVRPGYTRNDQSVEVRAGQSATLSVTLEPAADTGFELTSEPPGGLVWLDGNAMSGPDGQARTDFRAYRIPPGKHVLEIRGDPKRQAWREEVEIEPGVIKKVKAILVLVGSDAAKVVPPPLPPPAAGPVVAQLQPASQGPSGPGTPGKPGVGVAKPASNASIAVALARRRRMVREPRDSSTDSDVPAVRPRATAPPVADDSAVGGGDCTITVGTRPWSEIWIDGKNTGRHTPYSESINCGKHKLTFKRPDLNLTRTEAINVRAGEKFKQSFSLEEGGE